VVSRLVERGLVKREPSADDARRMEISITERGRKLMSTAPRTAQSRMQEAMMRMPREQLHSLAQGLEALLHESGFAGPPVPMFFEDDGPADG
jgi:DNA-binding MarR family transcriptional regulator